MLLCLVGLVGMILPIVLKLLIVYLLCRPTMSGWLVAMVLGGMTSIVAILLLLLLVTRRGMKVLGLKD